MEEASLDDFFAKKDKSKKKSKSSKIIPSDILETPGDEPVKKEKKKKVKEKTQTSSNTAKDSNTDGLTVNPEEEEEWKEVEEEKEKDYSGLRIANLQVTEKENEESEEQAVENVEEEDDDGEGKKKRDAGQQGPWVKSDGMPQQPDTPKPAVSEPQPEEAPKEESKPTTGKYIPPSQRGAAAAGGGGTSGPTIPAHLRRKKAAPNLRSEEDFPTLGGGSMPFQQDSDPRSFERVQHGGRQMDDPTKSSQKLSLGNKFSALQD